MANLNPMVYVKLVCHQCNQKYAFDVLPVNNQMPVTVKCPVCRVDGTPAANLFLAQKAMGITPTAAEAPAPVMPVVQSVPNVFRIPGVSDFPGAPAVQTVPAIPSVSATDLGSNTEAEWRRRAMDAEARAEQAQTALKTSLASHLADSLRRVVVQELAAQRGELLKAQQNAAFEIADLVQRLNELKVPVQERFQSYEAVIAELEKNLAERDEENRLLLKLKIEMTRQQLESERTRSRMDFN